MMLEYYVNLDERGSFYADLRRADDGVSIWEVREDYLAELIQDGYVRHGRDLDGLVDYWVETNIIKSNDVVTNGC
jgi:hypothetical protein